ncbi:MAG: two pore domain potassium channel family protein [Epsilonproteobacteria bacterium]|nr:MAG: two pore domain potassium channel family protein [Campylobacterota bacterium]
MTKISHENNFTYLFSALVTLFFSMSALTYIESIWLSNAVEILIVSILFISVRSLKSDKSWKFTVYIMMFFLLIIFISNKIFENTTIIDISHLFILLFFFVGSLRLSYRQILTSKEVNSNMIIGSLVLYFFLALIWATLYLLLLIFFPEGFNGLESLPWKENFSKVIYFSFATLTTLGYGDISPKNPISQFFVYAEAIVGVFYMAIIVSSLVSASLENKKN